MKRWLSVVMAAMMAVSLSAVPAWADEAPADDAAVVQEEMSVIDVDQSADIVVADESNPENGVNIYTVQLKESPVYSGTPVKPQLKVMSSGGTSGISYNNELKAGTNYEVVYSNNEAPGWGEARIRGLGAYSAIDHTFTFKIREYNTFCGSTRYKTAVEIARYVFPQGSDTVIIVDGTNFPDALSASPLSAFCEAPILLSKKDTLSGPTKELIKNWVSGTGDSNVLTDVIIVGGGFSNTVKNDIVACGIAKENIHEIAGQNRYETAEMVARCVQNLGSDEKLGLCYVATGMNPYDAMSLSAVAPYDDAPIFLAKADGSVRKETKALIDRFQMVCVIGGTSVVSDTVVAGRVELTPDQFFGDGIPSETSDFYYVRIGGSTRWETSRLLFKTFVDNRWNIGDGNCEDMIIVDGSNDRYVDALAAATLSNPVKCTPILLTSPGRTSTLNFIKDYASGVGNENQNGICRIHFVGYAGNSAVSTKAECIKALQAQDTTYSDAM